MRLPPRAAASGGMPRRSARLNALVMSVMVMTRAMAMDVLHIAVTVPMRVPPMTAVRMGAMTTVLVVTMPTMTAIIRVRLAMRFMRPVSLMRFMRAMLHFGLMRARCLVTALVVALNRLADDEKRGNTRQSSSNRFVALHLALIVLDIRPLGTC